MLSARLNGDGFLPAVPVSYSLSALALLLLGHDCWMSTCVLLFGNGAAQEQAFSQFELIEHIMCSGYLPGGSRT